MGQFENMKKLGFSDEEIADILACDKAIDRGETMPFDLSPEEHKKAVKNANVGEKQAKAPKKKEKDTKKSLILDKISNSIGSFSDFITILEPSNEIFFTFEGEKYAIKLRKTRK